MAVRQYANAPSTSLANACTALSTSINVSSVAGLPIAYPYVLIIDRGLATEEAVEVTAAAGTNLTIIRGVDSTTAFAHAAGAVVSHGITARDIREANAHVNASGSVHGVSGTLVGTTDTQTLTNKTVVDAVLTGNPTAPTPATSDNDTSLATTAFVKAALLAANPVGTIKMSSTNVNPGTYLGGTWVAWGSGRVPVGVDTGQSEFDTAEETGGEKAHTLTATEMPIHSHAIVDPGHQHVQLIGGPLTTVAPGAGSGVIGQNNTSLVDLNYTGINGTQVSGGGQPHNNLQPYITCYMFKRTA